MLARLTEAGGSTCGVVALITHDMQHAMTLNTALRYGTRWQLRRCFLQIRNGSSTSSAYRSNLCARPSLSGWKGNRYQAGSAHNCQQSLSIPGLFITEALHPFKVFREAGFEVDLVSETGTYQPDWLSQQKDWLPEEDRKIWEDHNSEFRSKLDHLLRPSDVKWDQVIMQCRTP